MSNYTHANKYGTLKLGNTVTISDGTYNQTWMIAGFDVEKKRVASDGSTYDNGYGIALVPVTQLTTAQWNTSNTIEGCYLSSNMHTSIMPTVATNLKKVLGSHLISRNVLLSNAYYSSSPYIVTGCSWATAYCTLMSICQLTGAGSQNGSGNDGEANYRLPVFNYTAFKTGSNFWSRGVWGGDDYYRAWAVNSSGSVGNYNVRYSNGVRPLIYIR